MKFALAIDLGTGGPKVGVVSLTGRVAWYEHTTVETTLLPGGGAVQDAAEWWRLILASATRGLASGAVDRDDLVAVSCTGQWGSTVPVDDAGEPTAECALWMDRQGAAHARRLIGGPVAGYSPVPLLHWIRRTGGAPSTTGADPIGHMLHFQHDRPDVAARTRWYLEPVDFLTLRFTGIAAATHASMAAAWLTDNRRFDRMAYDPDLVDRTGLDATKLPPLRPTASVIGPVRDDVAAEIGLPIGTPVIAGTPDLHSAAAGAGAVLDYDTHLAISSTSWISCPVPFKRTDARRQIASVPGITPNRYLIADNHETGGLCLQWLRDRVLTSDDATMGPALDDLTALAANVPAGAGDVLFTPWLAGERSPVDDHNARGGFHNLSLSTSRADLVRAVLEGVAYNSRWLHGAVERFARRRLDPIRFIGGGAQSDLWCQIHADVMDRTVERVAEPVYANLRGAALIAGIALGEVRSEQLRTIVETDATFVPDSRLRAIYDHLYREFPKLYRSQRAMFRRLNRARSHS
ncbi:MAG: xylulokinase [Acidimicrobiia bacterium]